MSRSTFTNELIDGHCRRVDVAPRPIGRAEWEAKAGIPIHHLARGWRNLFEESPGQAVFEFCPDLIATNTSLMDQVGQNGLGGWETVEGYVEAVLHIIDSELVLWDSIHEDDRPAAAEDMLADDIGFDPMVVLFQTQAQALDGRVDPGPRQIDWINPDWFT